MSRTTQYVGLNKYAQDYVKNAVRVEEYPMTHGMFNEVVMGNIYHMEPPKGPNKEYRLVEVVQIAPWSSGPVILTCLKSVLVKECGQVIEDDQGYEFFRWMMDPSLSEKHIEVDYETGRYYI